MRDDGADLINVGTVANWEHLDGWDQTSETAERQDIFAKGVNVYLVKLFSLGVTQDD